LLTYIIIIDDFSFYYLLKVECYDL